MSLPKHTNPRPERTASAPYNFIPLPEVVVKAVSNANELPHHSRYDDDRHTGHFEVKLTTKSPLYVRCPSTLEEFLRQERGDDANQPFRQQAKNTPHFFYTRDPNQPVIPGSSLRGMLRSLLKIVSYVKVERVTDSLKITYRAVAAAKDDPLAEPYRQIIGKFGRNVRAGYLVSQGDDWYIRPAKKPSDFKLPDRSTYLKVKERRIPDGAIPGFVRLNSENYKPQYHAVTFEARVKKDKNGHPYTDVSNIGPVRAGFHHQGMLVCSGNMLETGGEDVVSPRKNHALILEPDEQAQLVKINDKAIVDYVDSLTHFQKESPFNEKTGCLENGRPVFYVEDAGEVVSFGHCPNFRVLALLSNEKRAATPLDFVPIELREPEDVDYADAMFGYIKGKQSNVPQGSKARAYAGRVFVTDAPLGEGQSDIWLSQESITPKILATPKPTAFQHYLTQGDDNKRTLKHYGSQSPQETVIRGHKRYWHQALGSESGLSLDEIRSKIEEERQKLQDILDAERRTGKPETQHTQFKPVRPEVQFNFRIYVENLSSRELGALCWVLHPLGDAGKTYCHHLGMGKPLGMGAVKLEATLHLSNREARYSALFDGDDWQTGAKGTGEPLTDRATSERLTSDFEQHVLSELNLNTPCQHLFELKRIGMLLKMMEWPGFPPEPGPTYLTQ